MTTNQLFEPLLRALDEQSRRGAITRFWFRDDDAVQGSKALGRLLSLTFEHDVPLALAVIPAYTGADLKFFLADSNHVSVLSHGWSHQNHALAGEKKQELGSHRSVQQILAELSRGRMQLEQWHKERFVPVLVPPWNRIADVLLPSLKEAGFHCLSTFGKVVPAPVEIINTHVDIIDWKGSRGGRKPQELVSELSARVQNGTTPIGLLTHHLVHDNEAWDFLEKLLPVIAQHPGASWEPIAELMTSTVTDRYQIHDFQDSKRPAS